MRSFTSSIPSRRTLRRTARRIRRRPALVAATLTVGLLLAAGMTATAPASQAEASGTLSNFALASFTSPAVSTVAASASDTDLVSTDADDAITGAAASVTAATTVAADIAASGLDVGVPVTTVDTAELEAAVDQLERADILPAAFVQDFTEDVTTLAASVDEQVSGLRGRLDAAIAVKAEQEAAAEKARVEAEAAATAAAEAAAAKKTTTSSSAAANPVYATGGSVGGSSPADAQATARVMIGNYGWGDDQFACLVSLWNKESGWNYAAHNRSSGAYGIPQALPGSKMASAGADWQTNAATQISWGLGYISGRYGTPCGAWGHSQSTGWY
ncbi:lytic transglycosylase domain-containing protein [Microbacterium allomyrinae]|uniref:Lytic transglycosylase domain-containing protein n=1 Tax=Microbacterium allomyrinae TaxID=2830666 RepID=A0A9X1LSN2_9MICO|nr:lytic transglycosylase domain-containing protein [Microbacterium allomyrinae]MCC2031111.1 lytic transglycosylase domain-containing protein [Microbacterium allomyrinae]